MKILIITTSYPVKRDGSEAAGSYVEDFVKTLSNQVDVAVVYPVTETVSQKLEDDIFHFPFPVSHLPLSLLSPVNLLHWSIIVSVIRAGQMATNKAVQTFKPDHILALWALPSGYWAKNIYDLHGIPYSTWALGSDIWTLGKIPIIKSVLKNVLKKAQFCFADGYQLCDDVARISGREAHFLPSTRILPLSKTKELKKIGSYNLAFLGRWHQNKGIDLLLDALELLNDSDWEMIKCFKIAGGGPLEKLVKNKVKALEDMNRPIMLLGFLATKAATEFLETADYLVIPSRIESIPVIFSDALQTSTPMVVTPVGDFPVLFENLQPGIIASEVTAESLSASIRKLLVSKPQDFYDHMNITLQQFTVEKSVKNLLEKLNESNQY